MSETDRAKSRHLPNCREIRGMIPAYLEGKLTDRQTDRLLEHVKSCRTCYEELEMNFMVDCTVRYLDGDPSAPESFDMQPLLKEKMEDDRAKIKWNRRIRRLRTVIFLLTVTLAAFLILDIAGIFAITQHIPR